MVLLNYIYFAILTAFGIMFLNGKKAILKSPFNESVKMRVDGLEMFWILTFSTGIIALQASGGIDLMAIRLLALEGMCILAVVKSKIKIVWTFPLILYVVLLLWIIAGCFYGRTPSYGFRVFLKYLYPLLITLTASAIVRDKYIFIKSIQAARWVGLGALLYYFTPIGRLIPGFFWYPTAGAINFISLMTISVGLYFYTNEKKNLRYSLLFLIPCFLFVFRTSIMGSLVALMVFSFIKFRTKSLPIIAGIFIAGVVAVFTLPSLHQKMFKDDSADASFEDFQNGELTMDNVNTNARADMWAHLEDRFFVGHEIIGSGSGSVQEYMYNNFIFGGLKVPHSDFVQMKCDHGMIGLTLYILITLLIFLHCCSINWSSNSTILQLASALAGATILGVGVCLYSDNTINYSMATLSMPYGLYGMTLGLKKVYE